MREPALKEALRLEEKMKKGAHKNQVGRPPGRKASPARMPAAFEMQVMTVGDIAQYLHCHISTIYRLLGQSQIPAFHLGGDWRFLRSDVDKWIAAGGGKPSGSVPAKTDGRRRGRRPAPKN